MIRIIGFQKFVMLLILAGIMVTSLFFGFYIFQPKVVSQGRELQRNQSAISEMTTNIENLRQGIEKFETQKDRFLEVEAFGFFDPQDRVEARQRVIAMQKESRLATKYTVGQVANEENALAKDAGYKVLNTEILFSIEAIEDSDIFEFLYLLNYGFPGQVSMSEITIQREKEITEPLLRQIGLGEAEAVVTASVDLVWRTMVEDTSIIVSNESEDESEEGDEY